MKNCLIIGIIAILYLTSCSIRSKAQEMQKNSINNEDTSLTLLTLVYEGCSPCQQMLGSNLYQNCKSEKKIINVQQDSMNRFIGQALWNTSFPTVYFLTRDYNIQAITINRYFFVFK